ncbi:hypothetical protein SCUCBS95973_000356 [Sporothrix curviconia]|uniref:Glucose-repressible protein n=1 Tax=Sporothrix curviconia TaxID=1260050 RepID=A0ABP0API2_9PEZI
MDTIKQAGNYVSDKVNSLTADASHEANKNVAKDSNQSIGNRVEGAGNAVKDKIDSKGYDASAEANKQAATH